MRIKLLLAALVPLLLFAFDAATAGEEVEARYGINFYSPKDWNRQQPFLNVMKTARPWISQSQGKWDDKRPLALDEHDYVTRLEAGQWAATLMLTSVGESFPGGDYIFLYDGEGEFEWKGIGRLVSKEPGRHVVRVTPDEKNFVHLIMTSLNPDNYPRNMRFVQAEFEKNHADLYFRPRFVELWRDADTFRFMDWTLTNTSKLSKWSARPLPQDRTYFREGVALEDIVRLMNTLKVNGWINIPHLADDDYIRSSAQLVRDTADPALTVYYEFSNEVWNGMFPATRHAGKEGVRLGLATEEWRAGLMFYAQECKRMFAILDEVYNGQPRERYRKVIASQAANLGVSRIAVESFEAYKQADCLAIAPYLTFNVPIEKSKWNPLAAAEVETWSMDELFAYLNDKALPQCLRWMDEQKKLAAERGLELVAYEGGQHLSLLGEANKNKKLNDLLAGANRDPRMGDLYLAYLGHWRDIGGGVFCLFNAMQPYTNAGYWGLLEYLNQDTATAPKYLAVRKWAESLPSHQEKKRANE